MAFFVLAFCFTLNMRMIKTVDKIQRCGLLVYVGQAETRVATTRLFCQIFADYDSRLVYCIIFRAGTSQVHQERVELPGIFEESGVGQDQVLRSQIDRDAVIIILTTCIMFGQCFMAN